MSLADQIWAKGQRAISRCLDRDLRPLSWSHPVVSFTFDDAPRSAFDRGGSILRQAGGWATYYCALGLLNTRTEVGQIASLKELQQALAEGHELGCHTYDHLDAWHTSTHAFIHSIDRNALAFKTLLGLERPAHFAYPKSGARWPLKRFVANQFLTCRGGASSVNQGVADFHLLNACFLDQRAGWTLDELKRLIDLNRRQAGWLILATHDVDPEPSIYGCTPAHLEAVVGYAAESGARLWTLSQACRALHL